MIESGSWDAKCRIYWSVATVLLCSSIRQNPKLRHVVYTNSTEDISIRGVRILRFLRSIGVEIIHMPFRRFVPPGTHCKQFRNAFYKLDVLSDLGQSCKGGALLLDSDCIALRPADPLIAKCTAGKLLLHDVYRRADVESPEPHGISRLAMGKSFQSIAPGYKNLAPIWYGGELVGGDAETLTNCGQLMAAEFETVKRRVIADDIRMDNEAGFFDNDEFFASFVYNQLDVPINEAAPLFGRFNSNVSSPDQRRSSLDLVFAHLPGEKSTGLRHLFVDAIDLTSDFWMTPLSEFGGYLREFLGMPDRTRGLGAVPEIYSPTSRWVLAYRRLVSRLRLMTKFGS